MLTYTERKEIEEYFPSYNYFMFNSILNKVKLERGYCFIYEDKLVTLLIKRNKELLIKKYSKEEEILLNDYNRKLYFLTNRTVNLYRRIHSYNTTSGYVSISVQRLFVLGCLILIEEYSEIIKFSIFENKYDTAIKIREYCILFFEIWIDVLKLKFGIDIYSSPLKKNFKTVKRKLHDSINFEELKAMNELNKRNSEALKKNETDKSKSIQIPPDQDKTLISEEVKKEEHAKIFSGNSFEIWQSMFTNFAINESKKTDLRFMYEVMKYNKQIHKSVTPKNINNWINDTYGFSIEKLNYTDFKSGSNYKRMCVYNLIK